MQIDSIQATELIFELFQHHRWLLSPGPMQPEDAAFESEALQALLSLNARRQWQDVSAPAARVACSLLLDFLLKAGFPNHPAWAAIRFETDPSLPREEQAFALIAAEILRSHPGLQKFQ